MMGDILTDGSRPLARLRVLLDGDHLQLGEGQSILLYDVRLGLERSEHFVTLLVLRSDGRLEVLRVPWAQRVTGAVLRNKAGGFSAFGGGGGA